MAVVLRLARHGTRNAPFYRLVATDSRSARDGRFLENLGTYDPTKKPEAVRLKYARIEHWMKQGARSSDLVRDLLKRHPAPASAVAAAPTTAGAPQ